jgi:hypothetical protein
MIQVSVKSDIDRLTRWLGSAEKEQVPYASALALTRTAQAAQARVKEEIPRVFDRPTPLTMRSVRILMTRKGGPLTVNVYLQDEAAKGTPPVRYLFAEVEGGERNETRFERALRFAGVLPAGMAVVPGKGAPLDRYGNVKNGIATSVLSQVQANAHSGVNGNETVRSRKRAGKNRARYFVGRPGGGRLPLGIYQRLAHGVKPIFIFVGRRPTYRPRLPFYALVQAVVDAQFEGIFRAALDQAMRTAK